MIIEPTKSIQPTHVIFWGVGLTDSDKDLLDLFRKWCHVADQIDFIDPKVADFDPSCSAMLRFALTTLWRQPRLAAHAEPEPPLPAPRVT